MELQFKYVTREIDQSMKLMSISEISNEITV